MQHAAGIADTIHRSDNRRVYIRPNGPYRHACHSTHSIQAVSYTHLDVYKRQAEDPLKAVAKGTGVALKNIDKFKFLIR